MDAQRANHQVGIATGRVEVRHELQNPHEKIRRSDNSCNSCRAPVRFCCNFTLIALAHVALIVGLIRWSVAARASTNAESIVWLGSAEDLAARENEEAPSAQRESHAVEPKPPKDEPEEEKPAVTTAKSEIELPSPTPKPTPKPAIFDSTPKPKVTPKATPKPAPKKVLLAKASPKQVLKTKPSSTKSSEKSDKNEKPLPRKPELLRAAAGKPVQPGKVAAPVAEAARQNSAGMATCFMIAFTAPGFSRPPASLPALKFRL